MNKVKDPETQKPDPENPAREEMIERELSRRHLLPFVKRLVPTYKVGWFHEDLAARLERFSQRVENGESPRLIINVPPRHGKSELASKALIAWHLGRNPSHKVISATHSDRLAMDNSRDVLNYTKQPRFQNVFRDFAHAHSNSPMPASARPGILMRTRGDISSGHTPLTRLAVFTPSRGWRWTMSG
jgi:hypothetical protein